MTKIDFKISPTKDLTRKGESCVGSRLALSVLVPLLVLGFFLLPFLTKMSQWIPGSDDAFQVLGQVIYMGRTYATANSLVEFVQYFSTPQILLNFSNSAAILDRIFGEPLSYNLIWVSSFVLSYLGAFWLTRHLTRNTTAAIFAGLVFSLSPLHVIFSLGFGGATHIEWIPFMILFLIKYFEKARIRDLLLTTLFFLFLISNEPHFAIYIVLFCVLLTAHRIYTTPKVFRNKRFLWTSGVGLVIAVTLASIIYFPLLKTGFSDQNYLNPGIEQTTYYSADLLNFFTPSPLHPLWGNLFNNWLGAKYTGNPAERTVYIGFVVIFLGIIAWLNRKKAKGVSFWIISAGVFSVFSLGPFLHVLGTIEPKIPMPYLLLYHYIPFFENIRATGRIFIIASLCFAVLSGYGMKFILERFRDNNIKRWLIPTLIFGVLLLEFATKIPTSPIEPPAFYKQLNNEPGDFAIMQPLITTTYPYASMAYYYNAYHKKKVIGNDFSIFVRPKPGALEFEKTTPVINELMHLAPFGPQRMDQQFIRPDYNQIGNFMLHHNKIKYIILDKDTIKDDAGSYFTPTSFAYYRKFIESNFQTKITVNDDKMLVYEILPTDQKPLVMTLGDNWNKEVADYDGQLTRWLTTGSTLTVRNYSTVNKQMKLSMDMTVRTDDPTKQLLRLEMYVNDQLKASQSAIPNYKTYIWYVDNLLPGDNSITFKTYDRSGTLLDTFFPGNTDNKVLNEAILVKNVQYQEILEIDLPKFYDFLDDQSDDFAIIQSQVHSNYSFAPDIQSDTKVIGKEILELSDIVTRLNQETGNTDPATPLPYQRMYMMLPLLLNRLDYDEISHNFDFYNADYSRDRTRDWLTRFNARYLILQKDHLTTASVDLLRSYAVDAIRGTSIAYEDSNTLIFDLRTNATGQTPELVLGPHWGELTLEPLPASCTSYCRKLSSDAIFDIYNRDDKKLVGNLSFTATIPGDYPYYLQPVLNGQPMNAVLLNQTTQTVNINLPALEPGMNTVTFQILGSNRQNLSSAPIQIMNVAL